MMDIALKLEGLYRNASTHAAGVVIGDRPLVELVPLYRDPDAALPATQFNMKTVEMAGLVKFDFLGLKTLDVLQQAVELLQAARRYGRSRPSAARRRQNLRSCWPRAIRPACSSWKVPGMRDVLRKLKPNRFEDIIALVALYRPGPMDNIPTYIRCKNGEEPVNYLHPMLRADPRRHVRHPDLSGTSDAGRADLGRLQPRRRRSAAPRDGQEESVGNGGAARQFHQGRGEQHGVPPRSGRR